MSDALKVYVFKSDDTSIRKLSRILDTGEWEPEGTGECGARIWCPDLLHEGQWHHIAIVLNRAVLKNSSFSLYLDGQHIHSQKVIVIEISIDFLKLIIAQCIYLFS